MRRSVFATSLPLCAVLTLVTIPSMRAQSDPDLNASAQATATRTASIRAALTSLQILLEQTRTNHDSGAEANTLAAIANSYSALHQQQMAVESFQAALLIWRQLGNREHEASTLAHIGDVYREWGFPEQANRHYRDALMLYPATDKAGRGATLNNLSLTYFSLNNRKKCIESLNDALGIFREIQDRRSEALALANLGTAYVFLANDPMRAIDVLQQAITKLEILNDRDTEAGALDKMGVAWHNMGKPEMAGLSFQHALELFHAAGDAQGESEVRKHMRALGEQQTQASFR